MAQFDDSKSTSTTADLDANHHPAHSSVQLNGVVDADAKLTPHHGQPLVETVSTWHPDFDVMRPLSVSTLDLHFPQLASFDLYLHSEIE
jgi:hypothetical protein